MADKTIHESPTITDVVVLDLLTPDVNDCHSADPYKVDTVAIFYVERDFTKGNVTEFESVQTDDYLEKRARIASNNACVSPTPTNIDLAKKTRIEADSYKTKQQVFYNEALPVATFGTPRLPAWLATDTDNAFLEHVTEDEDGNRLYGHYRLRWKPMGMREGNYFACWTWTPLPAGETLSAHQSFALMGNTVVTTSIPTHFTPKEKYDVLLDRYLPEMYHDQLGDHDMSPSVLTRFNSAVAKGFTVLEDLANQLVDLNDANASHEAFLSLLGNTFDLKLRSDDPTRWRRQIKRAVPLYKKKGTLAGLKEAFDLAGMKLNRVVRLWQINSPYTWVEGFRVEKTGQVAFVLAKVSLSIDDENFEVSYREGGSDTYSMLTSSDVEIVTEGGVSTLTLLANVDLSPGDVFRVMYQYATIPNPTKQDVENYIRLLPLADQRDEMVQEYPHKNWNVRILEEDDPLFGILISNRHPYHDFLVFGKIRTEFAYSENVYNMEEYNGSNRESLDPCRIDKEFVDPCGDCQGSKFMIDVEVENLSNDRIMEARNIIEEYVPFHAVPHAVNFGGTVNDFIQPPVESIECLILYRGEETVVCGTNMIFNRAMDSGTEVYRNMLATSSLVANGTATAYNRRAMLYSPNVAIGKVGLSNDPDETRLEIHGPHPHATTTPLKLVNAVNHAGEVSGTLTQPLNQSAFTFTLSNVVRVHAGTNVAQDNVYRLQDAELHFGELGLKTTWDTVHGNYTGTPWKIEMTTYSGTPYSIDNVLSDGSMELKHHSTLPMSNATSVAYRLLRPDNSEAHAGSLNLKVDRRGLVTLDADDLTNIRQVVTSNSTFYMLYQDNNLQYPIVGFIPEEEKQFLVSGWSEGGVGNKTVTLLQRLVDKDYGLLTYEGMGLVTPVNHETALGICNGVNPIPTPLEDSRFKESFLIKINHPTSGAVDELFAMAEIDGTTITLEGDIHYWKTLSGGGTLVNYEVYRYATKPVTIDGTDFQRIDRRGVEVITSSTEAAVTSLSTGGPKTTDYVRQNESISYVIEYKDGRTEEGVL